ncbi:MAG: phosphate acetyltransferase [Campylobacterales bacterium]|nr:phosphate acetyltransferase [Campylobacterales bacterium]
MKQEPLKSLYIVSKDPKAGSMLVAFGMMDLLKRRYGRVAFFRPLVENVNGDEDIKSIMEWFGLKQSYDDAVGVSLQEVEMLLSLDKREELIGKLLDRYLELYKRYDFVLCMGIANEHLSTLLDFDINVEIAKNFSAPIIGLVSPQEQTEEIVEEEIRLWQKAIEDQGNELFMLFVNRCLHDFYETSVKHISQHFSFPVVFLPDVPELDSISVGEILTGTQAKLLFGNDESLHRIVGGIRVGAMQLEHFLDHIEDNDLVVTPADRSDIVMGTLIANESSDYPSVSAIVLCGEFGLPENLMKMIESAKKQTVPILHVPCDTYQAVKKIERIKPRLSSRTPNKIATVLGLFHSHIKTDKLFERLAETFTKTLTPAMFRHQLFENAAKEIKNIILSETEDERILHAADLLLRRKVVKLILLGKEAEIQSQAKRLGLDLKDAKIVDPADTKLKDKLGKSYFGLRKHKGITLQEAADAITNKTLFGTMMVYEGLADGMVSGATHTTRETILPALQTIKTKPGFTIVSSCFFMCFDTAVLVYADCAVNPDPTASELAQIAIASADTAKTFGLKPQVAMLSYSSGTSGVGSDVEKVREATRLVKQLRPDIPVEGPIQYDAAIDPEVGASKMPESSVAGHANIFIFPDLNTGNNTYKAVQRSAGVIAVGPVLQGLKKPVNDLSRGCSIADIVDTVALTAIQAQD